ncbi:DHA2 family efflux MFS transporter permease subunit [Actinoplanes sp. NPDC051861]|uniref:DHA2 family efflux MFS transporter permease subunit n=1 Tax=Actinoplanes sp. NPDC051861 TaxID=3155170 RepID=UPI00342C0FFF
MSTRATTRGQVSVRRIGLTLALGGLMVVVDTTVTVVAVPAIVAGLDAPLAVAQWVTTGYLLGIVAVIPVGGWAMSRFGARRVYLTALVAFTLFSALAGLAWSALSLAVFRFLQGLGGGLLNPVGQAIGLRAAPREQRGRLMSLLVLPLLIGPALGPLLGGWLIDAASWRWIFLMNVPLGAVALLVCARVLPLDTPDRTAAPRVDWVGLAQLSGGAVALVLGATLLDRPGGPSVAAVAVLLSGLGVVGAFLWRARRVQAPLVDIGLLARRQFRAAAAVLVCFGAAYFGSMSVLPLFVQGVHGDSAALVGLLVLPQAMVVGVVAQIATRLVDRVPARRIMLTGTATGLAGAAGLLATTVTDSGYPLIIASSVLLTAGAGATIMPTMTVALRDLDGAETPRGTTLLALLQQLASALGVALIALTLSGLVTTRTPGGVSEMLELDEATRAVSRPDLAQAVGGAYVVPVLLLLAGVTIAARVRR